METVKNPAQLLASSPQCLDLVIERLVLASPDDNNAASDRAAAYYLRAQRDDQPADLLLAFVAAEQTVRSAQNLASAWFNRALILEALGLPDEAIASYDRFLTLDRSSWASEARANRNRLAQAAASSDAILWQRSRNALTIALRTGDRTTVARLIKPFPSAAQRYFEEELLPEWATSPTQQSLDRVHLFAAVLSERLKGDPYSTDIANAIDHATPEQLNVLKEGHLAYQKARLAELAAGTRNYTKAEQLLRRGDSPLYLATLGEYDVTLNEAMKRYGHFAARIHWRRAHSTDLTDFINSLREYEQARRIYANFRDDEGLVAVHTRLAGAYRKLGDQDNAWRSAFYASRFASHLIQSRYRQAQLSEAANAAADLGALNVALFYENAAVREARDHDNSPAIALRARAEIQLKLQHSALAAADLARAAAEDNTANPDARRILRARFDEVSGQQLLQRDLAGAIRAFQSAYDHTAPEERTNRVSILNQLADAEIRAKRSSDAEGHLNQALSELREEQTNLLAKRTEESPELWRLYFSRFQDAHRLLIRLRMERGREEEAYMTSEQSRAIELLDLIRKREPSPVAKTLPEIQAALPSGTFLVQYAVLPDRVYAWIISHNGFKALKLTDVNEARIARWNDQVKRALGDAIDTRLDIVLRAGYERLVAAPLQAIAQMRGDTALNRLVFIPDGGIHGLPIGAFHAATPPGQYVMDIAPVEISGSTRLYLESLRLDRSMPRSAHPTVLAVGDPAFDENWPFARNLGSLPFAKLEAIEIQQQYMPGSVRLIGSDATAAAVLERAPQHEIVHVGAHMLVNAKQPSNSLLMLAGQPLDAETFLNRTRFTKTRLFVFAACSSVGGVTVGPEGVAPMVRAALAGGVPAVVGSLWNIGDATTRDLMVSFHRHYEASGDAALALQQARRDLLSKTNNNLTRSQSVFAWAPFQVIGHTSANAARAPDLGGTSLGIHSSHSLQRPDRLRPQ